MHKSGAVQHFRLERLLIRLGAIRRGRPEPALLLRRASSPKLRPQTTSLLGWLGCFGCGVPRYLDLTWEAAYPLLNLSRIEELLPGCSLKPYLRPEQEKMTLRAQVWPPLPRLSVCACFPLSLRPPLLFPSLLGWGLLNYHFSVLLMCSPLRGGIIILGDD